jgi:hypothetical protein
MKTLTAVACFALVVGIGWAQQNRLPQEEAKQYARPCAEQAALLDDAQIKTDVDPDKPCAERGEGGGAMVIPEKQLAAPMLLHAGKDVTPVGQLWLRKWTLVLDGQALPKDRLRMVTVNLDNQDRPMPLFLLGARRGAAKDLELVLYAKESDPLLVLSLTKVEIGQNLPLELEWKRGEKNLATLTLSILGKYQTVMTVTTQEN